MTSLQRAMWLLDEVLDELGGRSDTIEARKKIYRALDALAAVRGYCEHGQASGTICSACIADKHREEREI